MEYTKGSIGRIFLLKFNNRDIVIKEISDFVKKEKLKAATIIFLGALKQGSLVAGPKKPVIPPEPNWAHFNDAWETMGIGTIFVNKKGPQIHLHTAMGKKNKTLVGCLRGDANVFLVIEAVIFELKGIKASKQIDVKTGLNMLMIK